jgi:hypothetical protein
MLEDYRLVLEHYQEILLQALIFPIDIFLYPASFLEELHLTIYKSFVTYD